MAYPPRKDCPCGSQQPYGKCCQPLHTGEPAGSPEALMRSRFCAYALSKVNYIIRTTHPGGPHFQENASAWRRNIKAFCKATRFQALDVLETTIDEDAGEGYVTFHATLASGKNDVSFKERSLFRKHEGRWAYFSGEQ